MVIQIEINNASNFRIIGGGKIKPSVGDSKSPTAGLMNKVYNYLQTKKRELMKSPYISNIRRDNRNRDFTHNPSNKDFGCGNKHKNHPEYCDSNFSQNIGQQKGYHRMDRQSKYQIQQADKRDKFEVQPSKVGENRDAYGRSHNTPVASIALFYFDRTKGETIRSYLSQEIKERFLATAELEVTVTNEEISRKVYKMCRDENVFVEMGKAACKSPYEFCTQLILALIQGTKTFLL